jgi:Transglycosylase SLT domain
MTVAQQKAVVAQAAAAHGISPAVLWGVFGTESGFGANDGTSTAGAVGPFQLEPATATSLGVNPLDFTSAANGAATYLAQYKSRGIAGMLSAYNAGPAGSLQPSYVASVLTNAQTYNATAAPQAPATPTTPAASTASSTGLPAALNVSPGFWSKFGLTVVLMIGALALIFLGLKGPDKVRKARQAEAAGAA